LASCRANWRKRLQIDGKKQTKKQVLAEAGISTTSANRYEQLVGRGEKQADQIVNAGEPRVLCLDFPSLGIGDMFWR
jgi:hypothetical protein